MASKRRWGQRMGTKGIGNTFWEAEIKGRASGENGTRLRGRGEPWVTPVTAKEEELEAYKKWTVEERPCEMKKENWDIGGSQVTFDGATSIAAEARLQFDAFGETKKQHYR